MLKKILLVGLLPVALYTKAQVTLSVQLPPGGMVQKDQLWNMVVVNNSSTIPEAVVSLDIQDAVTGQTVLSAVSRSFILGKGVKVINIKDVQPLQYNYLAAELTGMYIPLGTYVACFRVIKNDIKGPEPVGDECLRVTINPLSPPLLNTPADRTILETNYPQFTWLPPAPVDMFNSLNYDLLIAEVLSGQSPAEAILVNTPVYTNYNLRTVYQNYPSTYSRLKEGQQYAWQVTARNGLNYAAQTEVWSFTIKPTDTVEAVSISNSYIELRDSKEVSGTSIVVGEELLVKYYSFDNDHVSTVRLLSGDGKLIREVKQKLTYGNNFFKIKLGKDFNKGLVYTVEVMGSKQNRYAGRFSIK
jgi:hypothetical protein